MHGDVVRIEDAKGQVIERDYGYGGVLLEERVRLSSTDANPRITRYSALGMV